MASQTTIRLRVKMDIQQKSLLKFCRVDKARSLQRCLDAVSSKVGFDVQHLELADTDYELHGTVTVECMDDLEDKSVVVAIPKPKDSTDSADEQQPTPPPPSSPTNTSSIKENASPQQSALVSSADAISPPSSSRRYGKRKAENQDKSQGKEDGGIRAPQSNKKRRTETEEGLSAKQRYRLKGEQIEIGQFQQYLAKECRYSFKTQMDYGKLAGRLMGGVGVISRGKTGAPFHPIPVD